MLKKYLKVLFFLLLSLNAPSQNIRIDSLIQLFATELDDTTAVNILNELSWEHHRNDLEKSFDYATQALNESKRIGFQKGEARAYNLQAIIYSFKGDRKLSIEANLKCLEIARRINSPYHIGIATNDLGLSYNLINETEKAFLYLQESLETAKKIKDTLGICFSLGNIGILHLEEGNFKQSEIYFKQSIELGLQAKDSMVLSFAYSNLGYGELEQKSYSTARLYFNRSKGIAKKIGDRLTLIEMIIALGDTDKEERMYELAETRFLKALSLIKNYGINDEFSLYPYTALADLHAKQQNYTKAIEYAQKGYDWAKEKGDLAYQITFCEQLYQSSEALNEIAVAFDFHKQLKILGDSLYDIEKAEKVLTLDSKYQLEQRALENQVLKEAHLKNEVQLKQKNLINLFILFALLVTVLFMLLFWKNYKKKKAYSGELEKEVSQRTEALIESNKKLSESNQELERFAYIASHDLKEPLRNISGFSRLINRELKGTDNNKIKEYLGFVEQNTIQMHSLIEDVLRYSQMKKEETLNLVHLNKVLDMIQLSLKHSIAERNAIFFIDTIPPLQSNETQLYQLFKNLIENAVKYNESKIPRVEIRYYREDQCHRITVSDNGIGIAYEYQDQIFEMFKRLHNRSKYQGSGLGLSIVKKVINNLGGEISLKSQQGKGSTFTLRLPLHDLNKFEPKSKAYSNQQNA